MAVRRAFAWAIGGQITSFALNFASSIIVAHLLTPFEMGIFAIGTATVGLISVFTSFGVTTYVVREVDLTAPRMDAAFTLNGCLALGLAAVIVVISFFSGPLLGTPKAGAVMRLLAVTPAFGVLTFRPATMLQREMQFRSISLINTAAMVSSVVATVAAAFLGWSYFSPAIGSVAFALVTLAGNLWYGRRYFALRTNFAGAGSIATFGIRMLIISGAPLMAAKLADIVLGRLLGVAALGVYSRASNMSGQIFDNLYGTATRVTFVQLAKDYRETGLIAATYIRSFRLITAVMWPVVLGLAVVAGPLVNILYGPRWQAAATPMSLLLIGQAVMLFYGMAWELFVLKDELKRQTRIEFLKSMIGLAFFSFGCLFSLVAAAAARIVDQLIGLALYGPQIARLADAPAMAIRAACAEGIALAIVAIAPTAGIMVWHRWSAATSPIDLAFGFVVGVVAWLAALAWRRHPVMEELIVIVTKFGGARRGGRRISAS